MPLISVVTATYNALDGLCRTVDSVREQTLDGVEHVIVDGGSTDGTVAYLQSLGDAVRWVSEPDDGIADAMNKGVAMARGDYVLFIHADDTLRGRDVLADVLAEGAGQDLISGQVILIEKNGVERPLKARNLGLFTELRMSSPHQGLLVRRSLFGRLGGFDKSYRIAMDYDFLIRAKRAGASFRVSDMVIANMPATGVSTRKDWVSTKARLSEDMRLQIRSRNGLGKIFVMIFWAMYYPFKYLRQKILRNV